METLIMHILEKQRGPITTMDLCFSRNNTSVHVTKV